jgi:hypothetical protein
MISDLGCITLMRALLRLSLHIRILIIGNIKFSLRNLVNLYMTALLDLSLIVSNLRSCGPLAYSDNERVKQLLYALDDHIWRMRITDLEESADFVTIDTKNCLTSSNFMNCLEMVILTMILLLLVRLLLLVLVLMTIMLTPPTPLSHLL